VAENTIRRESANTMISEGPQRVERQKNQWMEKECNEREKEREREREREREKERERRNKSSSL